jgi:hypothetical protein
MTRTLSRALMLIAIGVLAFPTAAAAEERDCVGDIGAETVDNLRVPQDASCTLTGTRVQGTVKVERDATLRATTIDVIGNVQAENAANVVVTDSRVGGSVQVKQGGGASVTDSSVTGDVQYDQNIQPLEASRNRVNGNVQVVGNHARASIFNNTIDANLQCKENEPPPIGGGNLVHGNAEDQCAGFAGGPGAPSGTGGPVSAAEARGASVSVQAARRSATLFRLGGRVEGDRRPLSGVTVTVQVRRDGAWHGVKRTRSNDDGRFRKSIRLSRGRHAVRVVVKRQAGFPATRASKTLRLNAR